MSTPALDHPMLPAGSLIILHATVGATVHGTAVANTSTTNYHRIHT